MGKRILVVDDDVNIRTALKLRLERDSFLVHTSADGEDALRQVSELHPDLVILDLALPRRDGLDVLAAMKASPATAGIPVVVLTARYQCREDHPVFLAASAEVVAKPFSPRELVRRVQRLLAEAPASHPPGQGDDAGVFRAADALSATG